MMRVQFKAMPTYEYKCGSCDYEFEQFQSIKARPLRKCPQCGRNALNRLIGTGAGIIFKGSGFYETDYRSDSYKKEQKKETASGKEKKEEKTKTEKPDTKSALESDSKKEGKKKNSKF
jgi:putative FmdB family regulatory protein